VGGAVSLERQGLNPTHDESRFCRGCSHDPQSVSPAPTGKAESKFKNLKFEIETET
jgi:hypothetical protein